MLGITVKCVSYSGHSWSITFESHGSESGLPRSGNMASGVLCQSF